MATVAELQSAYSDIDRKYNNALGQQGNAQFNLTRQQDVQKYNLAEAAKYEALAASLPAGSSEQIAALATMSKQKANAAAMLNNIDNAQKEFDGWTAQVNELLAALVTANTELLAAKAEAKKAEDEVSKTSENNKAENKQSDDNTTDIKTTGSAIKQDSASSGGDNNPKISASLAKKEPISIATTSTRRTFNPLASYSSSTYKISLYAMTADTVNNFYEQGKWDTTKLELIVQSGGITSSLDSPRNKWFKYDFGIDDFEINTKISGKSTGAAANSVDFNFKIFEPYAMTFPSRLVKLQQELQAAAKIKKEINQQVDAINTPFLLVLRFYGYDAAGNIVEGAPDIASTKFSTTTDSAAYERAWPILITKFTFKLDNKVTVYSINGKPIDEQVAFGTKRGVVNQHTTFTADTVENAIGGVASKKTNGLFDKLNSFQSTLVGKTEKDKKQEFSDKYQVRFTDAAIAEALIVDKNYWPKSRAALQQVSNSSQSTVRASVAATTIARGQRQIEIPTGTPILTAIDQIITQSSYITDALNAIDKEQSQPVILTDGTAIENPKPTELTWYKVTPEVRYINADKKRKDYAYEITYVIQKYALPYVSSVYSTKTPSYPGPTKIYNYIYTGKNSEVLSFEQDYNLLFFNSSSSSSEAGVKDSTSSTPNQPMAATAADATGKESGKFEIPNSIKTYLYSPGDQINTRIRILGDPDFLIPTTSNLSTGLANAAFGVNPNRSQVFIEVDFKQVEDYNVSEDGEYIENGLMNPNGNIVFWEYPPDIQKATEGRMVYEVIEVISRFSKGVFVQDLKMILPTFSTAAPAKEQQTDTPKPVSRPVGAYRGDRSDAPPTGGAYRGDRSDVVPTTATTRDDSTGAGSTTNTSSSDSEGRETPVPTTGGRKGL
jgi:hypothetical protein